MDKRLDQWLFESYQLDVRALALIRIGFATYVLLLLGQELSGISALPASAFHPAPGLATWLPVPMPEIIIHVLEILFLLAWVGLAIGAWTVWTSRILSGLILFYFAIGQGLGKIDHTLLMALFPLLMSWSGWGNAWSVDARRGKSQENVPAWPLALLALVIGFLWFSAACFKIVGGWLDPEHCAACWHHEYNILLNQRDIWLPLPAFQQMEWLDWTTVLFEGLFLPMVFFPRMFRLWIALAIGFHLMVQLSMGVDFTPFALLYTPFISWGVFTWRGKINCGPHWLWWPGLVVVLGLAFWQYGSLFDFLFGEAEAVRAVITMGGLTALGLCLWMVNLRQNT